MPVWLSDCGSSCCHQLWHSRRAGRHETGSCCAGNLAGCPAGVPRCPTKPSASGRHRLSKPEFVRQAYRTSLHADVGPRQWAWMSGHRHWREFIGANVVSQEIALAFRMTSSYLTAREDERRASGQHARQDSAQDKLELESNLNHFAAHTRLLLILACAGGRGTCHLLSY
jgi:hypothetical protein